MVIENDGKVTAEHLQRNAYLYVRQSSLKQVVENTESTKRQYALRQRAIGLGWSQEQVVVIDSDLGQSARPGAADREGFERLVVDVGLGRVGIVMGLEVSRLARSCSAWHRLLEICAMTATLVLDQDGLYDARQINDRLLLGLKGAISEAELHMIRQRMRGGALSKAARGELRLPLPVGFLYDEHGGVVLDFDKQVREAVSLLFDTFRRLGSAYKTARFFHEQGLEFPKRLRCGPNKGALLWGQLTLGRVAQMLHNPCYAGAYAYGRSKTSQGPDGLTVQRELPLEQWHTLILDAHEGYISWAECKRNVEWLSRNTQVRVEGRKCPPREGPALLQGMVVCGVCGRCMSVRYYTRGDDVFPKYVCCGKGKAIALPRCQTIPGDKIDAAIGQLLLETVTPVALEVSLAVQGEVRRRFEEADKLRLRQVDRARYEVDLARRRYMKVDPDNRLVADDLEAEWNRKLRALREAEEEYERQRERDRVVADRQQRERILSLAQDFPKLWCNPETPQRERKRMARLLIEDVTLVKNNAVSVNVRFKGGATRELTVPRALTSWESWTTSKKVVAEIDRLLEDHSYGETAAILNERGYRSGQGKEFDSHRIKVIRRAYGLRERCARLRDRGFLTLQEVAAKLGMTPRMVKLRRAKGTLSVGCRKLSDQGDYMYEDPGAAAPVTTARLSARTKEVQYER